MDGTEPDPPVAEDEFPEFHEPPRYKPGPPRGARGPKVPESIASDAQARADAIRERLRRQREDEG